MSGRGEEGDYYWCRLWWWWDGCASDDADDEWDEREPEHTSESGGEYQSCVESGGHASAWRQRRDDDEFENDGDNADDGASPGVRGSFYRYTCSLKVGFGFWVS